MKIYTEPIVELLHCSGQEDSNDWLIEYAGRTCTNTIGSPEKRNNFILNTVKKGHESIIEHNSATFRIICSRECQNQLVRHRVASFSVQSQRYVNYNKSCPFVVICSEADKNFEPIIKFSEQSIEMYSALIDNGFKPEDARKVLPNCMGTEFVKTLNFRELLHFFRLRLDKHAQYEIRLLAGYMLNQLRDFSIIFKEFESIK